MTVFVFPDGTSVALDYELCEAYDAETDNEAVVSVVADVLADWRIGDVPEWWKERYKQAIIECAIMDGHALSVGIVCNQRFNEWYASHEVPYGHVEFR